MTLSITTSPIADPRKNWSFKIEISEPLNISLRLVPDKLVADHASLKSYLKKTALQSWANPEEMILNIIEDVNNALVPVWLEVIYENQGVTVKIEDKQPGLESFRTPAAAD